MAEYIDREDALGVIDYIRTKYISVYNRKNKCSQFWADTIRYIEKQINNLDDYNVEPVVRCRDCQHYIKEYHCCNLHSEQPDQYSTGFIFEMGEDDFCSYGEKQISETE